GFSNDGLPIGIELLGRTLADGKLVAFAYDYEQSTHPRRAPSTTPALVGGSAPAPVAMRVDTMANGTTVRGSLRFDPTRRSLEYDVRVSGVPADQAYAITLDRSVGGKP